MVKKMERIWKGEIKMKEVAGLLLKELKAKIPVVFDDIEGAV